MSIGAKQDERPRLMVVTGMKSMIVSSVHDDDEDNGDNDDSDDVFASLVAAKSSESAEFSESQSLVGVAARRVCSLANCNGDYAALALLTTWSRSNGDFATLALLPTWSRSEWPTFSRAAASPISYQQPLPCCCCCFKKCPPCRRILSKTEITTAVLSFLVGAAMYRAAEARMSLRKFTFPAMFQFCLPRPQQMSESEGMYPLAIIAGFR
jgi:hypothetical protein